MQKIDELKTYAEKNSLEIDIEADGGINLKTAERVKNAGANILELEYTVVNYFAEELGKRF